MSDLRVYLPSPRLWKARCAYSRASGRFWCKAVIGRSLNVSQVQQETRTRRSNRLAHEPIRTREFATTGGGVPLERHVRSTSTTDIVRPPRHVRFVARTGHAVPSAPGPADGCILSVRRGARDLSDDLPRLRGQS